MNRQYPPAFGLSFVLHVFVVAVAVSLSARPVLRRIPVTLVPAASSKRAAPAPSELHDSSKDDEMLRLDPGASLLNLPGFEFDFRKVAQRAASLFPFLRFERLTFPRVAPQERSIADGFASLFARTPDEAPKAVLVLGDAALQLIVDGAWSRRERWRPFQAVQRLATTYNPQTGRMPDLLRRYVDQNALQPYVDTAARDPRLWIELGIAADHRDFIEFVNRYASQHPSTKATIELLFLLDKLAQGSFDALITLLDSHPDEDLRWTRRASGDAFKLIVLMQRYYRLELDRLGLITRYDLRTHYDSVRLPILNAIVNTTPNGYRASDARFLIGGIHWRAGRPGDAIRSWWGMTIDPSDSHVIAYSDILTAIRDVAAQDPSAVDPARITRVINRILDSDRGRWVGFSSDRLRQFGYRFDRF